MERSKSEVSVPAPPSSSSSSGLGRRISSGSSILPTNGPALSASMANLSANTSHNMSGSVNRGSTNPRRKSRFGALARSLLTSESTDSTLSPNSVRGIMNPFRSQLGLRPLEVSRLATSSETETDSSGSPLKSPIPVPDHVTPSTSGEPTQVETPTPPQREEPKPEYTPKDHGKRRSDTALPQLYSSDQNVPPRPGHPVAAVVPGHAPAKPNPIYKTPVASKSFCPPPAAPPSGSSNQQRGVSHSRSTKKPSSGWRFPTERVKEKEYLIMKQIGKGGCGEVSLVMEKESRELFALKKVNLFGLDQRGIEECINEIKLLVELRDTDLVIHIESWEMNQTDKTIKIVMEFGQCDLSKSISSDKINSLNQVKSIWERMLCIVQSIHQRGIVHADLKPANFVWVGGNLKIIDFGIANKLQADYTSIATLHPKGTLNFISPETVSQDQFGRTKISPKSDIWSLGCILHMMIFGRTPFQNITHHMAKISAIVRGVPAYPPLPPQFADSSVISVLQSCFELDPKQRPTASQLLSHPFLQNRIQ